jgi:hypothetical protein
LMRSIEVQMSSEACSDVDLFACELPVHLRPYLPTLE